MNDIRPQIIGVICFILYIIVYILDWKAGLVMTLWFLLGQYGQKLKK